MKLTKGYGAVPHDLSKYLATADPRFQAISALIITLLVVERLRLLALSAQPLGN
jgi:hypothetical protein